MDISNIILYVGSEESTNISKEENSTSCSKSPAKREKKNPLLNYIELDTLGCGSFGRVIKVQKKSNGQQYAMKVIEKKKMEEVKFIAILCNYCCLFLKINFR